jgi:lyso-ornithine lipid O-acyltransferase
MTSTPEKPPRAIPARSPADPTWTSPEGDPPPVRIGPGGWLRAGLRAPVLAVVVFGGLAVLLALRLIERPLFGLRRPVTPWITVGVCRAALTILGLRFSWRGVPMTGRGAMVANHVSWMDIFVMNAPRPLYFVAKSEVGGWPGIGWLARATGTVFIRRDPREAQAQALLFEARLRAGHRLCFFPEGTSTDGVRLLPFKPTLFAAFFAHGLAEILQVQPVSLVYRGPRGQDARFYGWWGEMSFGAHLLRVLAAWPQGSVEVVFHPPVAVADFPGRKELARHAEGAVRAGLRVGLPAGDWRD